MTRLHRDGLVEQIAAGVEALRAIRVRGMCQKPWQRDLSLPQLSVLVRLHDRGPAAVSSIAQQLTISVPSASALVDRMEQHGLVLRTREEDDRRVVTVRISARGDSVVEDFVGLQKDHLSRLVAVMSDEDLVALHRGLEALRRGLNRLSSPNAGNELHSGDPVTA